MSFVRGWSEKSGRDSAAASIDALITIGGDGTFRGAVDLPGVGQGDRWLSGDDRQDLLGTDYTI